MSTHNIFLSRNKKKYYAATPFHRELFLTKKTPAKAGLNSEVVFFPSGLNSDFFCSYITLHLFSKKRLWIVLWDINNSQMESAILQFTFQYAYSEYCLNENIHVLISLRMRVSHGQ